MRTRLLWILLLFGLMTHSTAYTATHVALVIGNNQYQSAPLSNPINDAKAVGQTFRGMGYTVIEAYNANRAQMVQALSRFGQAAQGAHTAVVYYAGHGVQVEGDNYLIPANTPITHRRDLRNMIKLDELVLEVKQARQLGLVMLDACRDNPFGRKISQSVGRSVSGRGLSRIDDTPNNVLVGFATKAGQIAADGKGQRHSPYAQALINLLPQRVEIRRLFGKIRDNVKSTTRNRQIPFTYGSLGGDALFLSRQQGGAEPVRPTLPAPAPSGTAHWHANRQHSHPSPNQVHQHNAGAVASYQRQQNTQSTINRRWLEPKMVKIPGQYYSMGKHEVTFDQWDACVNSGGCSYRPKDEGWGRGSLPVINVNWNDVQQYIGWLNRVTGKQYRLPTEQEWEFAAQAGSARAYPWGGSINCSQAQYWASFPDGGPCYGRKTVTVGRFAANRWGLHDTVGNVWEWTSSTDGGSRVLRGGSWSDISRLVRSGDRSGVTLGHRGSNVGFRLSRTP